MKEQETILKARQEQIDVLRTENMALHEKREVNIATDVFEGNTESEIRAQNKRSRQATTEAAGEAIGPDTEGWKQKRTRIATDSYYYSTQHQPQSDESMYRVTPDFRGLDRRYKKRRRDMSSQT
ncbi:hypothetical protein BKA61DRAFT_584959 [Leptodontidium sp. MPI-SDFR-AT-0119]|nr:hypothetical protein BKA61DRAFT_584959 [Leptodontidium sp. MPI-SDFR-AT-0119]